MTIISTIRLLSFRYFSPVRAAGNIGPLIACHFTFDIHHS